MKKAGVIFITPAFLFLIAYLLKQTVGFSHRGSTGS